MMRYIKYLAILPLFCTLPIAVMAQKESKVMSLDDCIKYAIENNITVKQQAITVKNSEERVKTSVNARLPDFNASLGVNSSFGRSINVNNTYINNTQLSGNVGVSTSVPIFRGFGIKHEITGAKLGLQAAIEDLEGAKDDISVNIMSLYLQALLDVELVDMYKKQLELSSEQLQKSIVLVRNGKQAESVIYEAQALVASDKLRVVQGEASSKMSLLDLSQALNIESDGGYSIGVVNPKYDSLQLASMRISSLEDIYRPVLENRHQIAAEELRLEQSRVGVRTAKAARLPQISLSAGYGSNAYKVFNNYAQNAQFWSQLRNNGSGYVGVSVSVPIFNRFSTRSSIRTALLSVNSQQLTLQNALQNLRKTIEQVYYQASTSYEKYLASLVAAESSRKSFETQRAKIDSGRSTIFDYNNAKMQYEKAESESLQAKWEYIFRCKLLDFYAGR